MKDCKGRHDCKGRIDCKGRGNCKGRIDCKGKGKAQRFGGGPSRIDSPPTDSAILGETDAGTRHVDGKTREFDGDYAGNVVGPFSKPVV